MEFEMELNSLQIVRIIILSVINHALFYHIISLSMISQGVS